MKNESLIRLFEENELNISELYGLFSKKIVEHKDFWGRLSKEEITHAQNIHDSQTSLGIKISEKNFTRDALNYVINFVDEKIEQIGKEGITHTDAIDTALRIERSIIEKKCFEFFEADNENTKDFIKKLNKETETHIRILEKERKREKARLNLQNKKPAS